MKKRLFAVLLCILTALSLCACGGSDTDNTDSISGTGSTRDVKIGALKSELYSEDELNKALKIVFAAFEKDFSGCRLTDISYLGDEASQSAAVGTSYTATILFDSAFYAESCSDGTYKNNSSYLGWAWLLGKNAKGDWELIKNGYQ